jgi:hypothetical protein
MIVAAEKPNRRAKPPVRRLSPKVILSGIHIP